MGGDYEVLDKIIVKCRGVSFSLVFLSVGLDMLVFMGFKFSWM